MFTRKIVFENGRSFAGLGFGASTEAVFPVGFNTSMVGYQEIMSDPACCGMIVCMTYPLIGSYGLNDEDYETQHPLIGGLIVREYNANPSNYRYTKTLGDKLEEHGIPGISQVDTRAITRMLRDQGELLAVICDARVTEAEALERIAKYKAPANLVEQASSKKVWYSRTANYECNVVAVDCGIKRSTILELNRRGCNVIVVPYNTKPEAICTLHPDGIYISGGPGGALNVPQVADTVKHFAGKLPLCATGLGHQLVALAFGGEIEKMKHPHRGANYAVRNVQCGSTEITQQNHGYTVKAGSVEKAGLKVTHVNVQDETVEGLECADKMLFTMQHDMSEINGGYDRFITMINKNKEETKNA